MSRYPTAELWNEATGCYRKVAIVITLDGTRDGEEDRLHRLFGARARLEGVPLYRNPYVVGKVLGSPAKRWRKLARIQCWADGWERPDLHSDPTR